MPDEGALAAIMKKDLYFLTNVTPSVQTICMTIFCRGFLAKILAFSISITHTGDLLD